MCIAFFCLLLSSPPLPSLFFIHRPSTHSTTLRNIVKYFNCLFSAFFVFACKYATTLIGQLSRLRAHPFIPFFALDSIHVSVLVSPRHLLSAPPPSLPFLIFVSTVFTHTVSLDSIPDTCFCN